MGTATAAAMNADLLLDKLDGVKRTGPGRWIAKCPAHEDRRASLSIRELDDGRVLVHDFAGCDVASIVAGAGLELQDLFPPRIEAHHVKGERRPFPAADVLRTLVTEITIVIIYVTDLRAGRVPSHEDHERFLIACSRITEASRYGRQ
jgi:hypothetical protein